MAVIDFGRDPLAVRMAVATQCWFRSLSLFLLISQTAAASVAEGLVPLAPASSTFLAGIDVRQAEKSPSGSEILDQTLKEWGIAVLASTIGFDVRRDVRQMLLVGLGQQPGADSQSAVIADGAFDTVRLINTAQAKGIPITHVRGVTVLVTPTGSPVSAIAFPTSDILVMGDLATVHAVIARTGAPGGIDPALREQVNRTGHGNDVWFATLLSGSFIGQQIGSALPPQLRPAEVLQRIKQSSGGLLFGPNDKVTLDLIASSSEEARLISGLLRITGSLVQMGIGSTTALSAVASTLSSMQVESRGTTVHATLVLSDEQLLQALKSAN